MRSLFALVPLAFVWQAMETEGNIAEKVVLLKAAGYPFVPTAAAGRLGTLEHNGATVTVDLRGTFPIRRMSDPPGVFLLSIELGFTREVPDGRSPLLAPNDPGPTPKETSFVSHLGRTVSVAKLVRIDDTTTAESLRTTLDAFWKETDDFARAHGGRFAPVTEAALKGIRISDDAVLERADFVSLNRLIDAWGWRYHGPIGFSGVPRWFTALDVDGSKLWIDQANDPNGRFQEDRITLRLMSGEGAPETVVIGPGIEVRELRRRILTFARRSHSKALGAIAIPSP